MLDSAAPSRVAAAESFMDTARPPASSAGLTIFDPLDSLLRLVCRFEFDIARLSAAMIAEMLVLITTDMFLSSLMLSAASVPQSDQGDRLLDAPAEVSLDGVSNRPGPGHALCQS